MGYTTFNLGLTIKQPTRGTTGYLATLAADTYTKISAHDHTGSGNGAQITTAALVNQAVTEAKIADYAITTNKIMPGSIGTSKLQDGAVDNYKAGFTFSDWTPTISGDGTAGVDNVSIVRARRSEQGKRKDFFLEFTARIITANSYWVGFSLPYTAANRSAANFDASIMASSLNATDLALLGDFSGARGYLYDTTIGIIRRGNAQLLSGSTYRFICSGSFEGA